MISLNQRIKAFDKLGREFEEALNNPFTELGQLAETVHYHNGWFTPENVKFAYRQWASELSSEKIHSWLSTYSFSETSPKTIGIIMAGNIPLVGFHDLLCVLISGNKARVKLSSKDEILMKKIIQIIQRIEPQLKENIIIEEHTLKDFDGIIATGSGNTSRYFHYYFGKYPHIIRYNRTSVAILTGNENEEDLKDIGWDIFRYYGLGCRSITKIFVPRNYDFTHFFEGLNHFSFVINNTKYLNNYEYNKAILLLNQTPHLDNGFLLLQENKGLFTPAGLVYYEEYETVSDLDFLVSENQNQLQCIISIQKLNNVVTVLPGYSQMPNLSDYADGIDTLSFLKSIQ